MSNLVWSGLYSFIANLAIGFYIFSKNPKRSVNIFFGIFSLTVGGWSVGSFLVNVIPDKELALFVLRCNYLFAVWLPSFYVQFIYAFTETSFETNQFKLRIGWLISALLSLMVFTPWFIPRLRVIENANFYISSPGPLYYVFFGFFAVAMCEVMFHVLSCLRKSIGRKRVQLQYVAIANAIAIFAGFEYFSRVFGFFDSPPLDDYILVIYLLVVAYLVIRRQLFDIDTIADYIQETRLSALGILASSVFHEIRSPLFTASGYAESLLKNLQDKTSEEKLNKIIQQIERATDIVKQFSKFVRPSEVEAKPEPIHVSEVIESVLVMIGGLLEKEKIKIEKRIDSHLNIHVNRRHLEEILINLVTNAYQAMPSGGTLTITALPERDCARISISDTGSGMSSAELKRIFDPFYTTKKSEGMGLGLYIVKKLVERNHGTIAVSSESGKGTTFRLDFPA